MYYKILKGTALFQTLTDIDNRRREVNTAALKFALRFNTEGSHLSLGDMEILGGGLSGILFEHKPDNWVKTATRYYSNVYRPKKCKANAELIQEWESLPIISRSEVNKALNFESGFIGNNYYYGCGVNWGYEFVLVSVQDELKDYVPAADMIEILGSEYKQLESELEIQRELKESE